MVFIDIHCHLDICKDKEGIVKRARDLGVVIFTCGIDSKSNRDILELSEKFDIVYPCLGIYPDDGLKMTVEEIDSEIDFIKKNKPFAIGEVGLDLYKKEGEGNLERQKKIFKKFILLAKELNIPLIVHSRKAEKEVVDFLESFSYDKIIIHCFCGNMKLVKRIVDNGWFLSIPASVKHAEHFQNVISIVPIKQLFCETDSPFLHPDKKFPNESVNVIESYKKIAEIKGIDMGEVEKKIEENFEKLFFWDKKR